MKALYLILMAFMLGLYIVFLAMIQDYFPGIIVVLAVTLAVSIGTWAGLEGYLE